MHDELDEPGAVGVRASAGARPLAHGFEEAHQAVLGAAVIEGKRVMSYDDLGAYKYLLRSPSSRGRDRHRRGRAARRLRPRARRVAARDARGVPAPARHISATSEALYVHPNTLRQRLRRIGELTGIDLRRDDWLMIEIAVKLVRLRTARHARPHT